MSLIHESWCADVDDAKAPVGDRLTVLVERLIVDAIQRQDEGLTKVCACVCANMDAVWCVCGCINAVCVGMDTYMLRCCYTD